MSKQKHFYPKKYKKKQKIKAFFNNILNGCIIMFLLFCMVIVHDAKEESKIAQEVKVEAPTITYTERQTFDAMLKKYVVPTKQAKRVDPKQKMCLAKNIFFEARGSDTREKILVAEVTLNRAEANGFPPDVCGVVYQKLDAAAFSWTAENHNLNWILRNSVEREAWHKSQFIAEKILAGEIVRKNKNILFYHAIWMKKPTSWKYAQVALKTEDHIYYRYSGK